MTYFENNYDKVRYPIRKPNEPGLRRAQIGAIHRIASYFTTENEPAIVVMPTGSGKTAVLMISAFVLHAKRVLVITPSRLVRYQIKKEFEELTTLKKAGVLSGDAASPKVCEVTSKISDDKQWKEIEKYDVAVVAPNSSSPIIEGVAQPAEDLFDLILVDEAHHSRAKTWEALIDSFPAAKKILFTATPFRRDQRELKGKLIYSYPVSLAVEDEIFGKIEYLPVEETGDSADDDVRIARQAATVFREDKNKGLHHLLMVRTDSKKRARELKKIYQENTDLNVQLIDSDHSYPHIKRIIEKLRRQEIDGIICVDMLGEGFDLPQLKIAAIHAPHKSLAITLQFIGRFARTNADNIDTAKFLAVPSTVKGTLDRLYVEGADLQKLVIELSETKIIEEVETREVIDTFENPTKLTPETKNLSLYSLRPYSHVKIFQLDGKGADLECDLPSGFKIDFRQTNHTHSMDLFITKSLVKPKWSSSDQFIGAEHHLFIVYFDAVTNLLFINSSARNETIYEAIALSYARGIPHSLSLDKINKVLIDLEDFDFFSIGMRSNLLKDNIESYKMISGASTQKSVTRNDGRLYNQGHIFGRAKDKTDSVTIGYSSSSKVWSNNSGRIPQFLKWSKALAERIYSNREVVTSSGLDWLSVGKAIRRIPEGVIAAGWDIDVYNKTPLIAYTGDGDRRREKQLLDFDLSIDRQNSSEEIIRVCLNNDEITVPVNFSLQTDNLFTPVAGENYDAVAIVRGNNRYPLLDYLNARPLKFYFADFSFLCGYQYFKMGEVEPFDVESQTVTERWKDEGVDIEKECGPCVGGKLSIQDFLKNRLPQTDAQVVFFDHGTGEIADFVTFAMSEDEITVGFYHCKGSGGSSPGARVDDAYEVCGQVLKSLIWTDERKLHDRIIYRNRTRTESSFLKGEKTELSQIFAKSRKIPIFFEIVVVQPGFSRSGIPDKIAYVLAGANDYIIRGRCKPLKVMCSD